MNGSYAAVRDFYVRRAQVVEIGELVRARVADASASDEETLARLTKAFPVGPRTRPERARLHDYLLGGGPIPPRPKRDMPKLTSIFEHVSPNDFNEVHQRALDLLVREPDQLEALERTVALSDAMFDLHARWREALFVRGVSEETVLRNATTAWLDGDPVHTHAWWVLDRIAADPGAFLARYAGDVREIQLHRRVLFASRITWDTPRLRGVAEELIAHHGAKLHANAVVELCQGTAAARLGALFAAHLGALLEGRSADDATRIREAVEATAALEPEGD